MTWTIALVVVAVLAVLWYLATQTSLFNSGALGAPLNAAVGNSLAANGI
jgi:hypothetical protein